MKVCVLQPPYSYDGSLAEQNFEVLLGLLDACDESLDLIVLPEYSDIPADIKDNALLFETADRLRAVLLTRVAETAKRCHAMVFVNAFDKTPTGYRNTTYAYDREGNLVGRYYKAHPAPSEVKTEDEGGHALDVSYSYAFAEPYTLEMEGLRFCFLTCYDFYFYENFPQLARQKPDIIIGCSLQRTDTHEALSIINRFLCYQTNAYLVRASVSLGEDSKTCGCSTVITPRGEELVNMKNRVGLGACEIDPAEKYYKPAGYGGVMRSHHEYVEEGRRPWLYRNGGASVILSESRMPYPRLCAHRGFCTVAPENSLPAYGAAVALGAEEIEMDLWATKDGVLVSAHDETLERVSNGTGKIGDHTYEELLQLDFGVHASKPFGGLQIPTFEQILQKFAGRAIINLHVKIWDAKKSDPKLEEIVALIRKYDAQDHVYFMTTNDEMIRRAQEYAPDIACCVGWDGNRDPMSMVDRAIALGTKKIQLFKPYFNEETVKRAHEHGIRCNVFWADDPEEAIRYREMGIDTILTNDYLPIKRAFKGASL